MKYLLTGTAFGAVFAAALSIFAASWDQPGLIDTPPRYAQNASKACIFPSGGWTTIDSDNSTGNASGTLAALSRYVVQCDDAVKISFGGTVADSGDGTLPAGAWLEFGTANVSTSFSVLNVTSATADCFYIECE